MKTAYTDYPFISLGDAEFKQAPVREIKIISYDGDKYVKILVEGRMEEIKAGYVYLDNKPYSEARKMRFPRTHVGLYNDN